MDYKCTHTKKKFDKVIVGPEDGLKPYTKKGALHRISHFHPKIQPVHIQLDFFS